MVNQRRQGGAGRIYWAMLAYVGGFAILIGLLLRYFILPGLAVMNDPSTSDEQRQRLAAMAALLMALVLQLLLIGLLVVFRMRRLFNEQGGGRQRTAYVDAWAESAKRVSVEPDDDEP